MSISVNFGGAAVFATSFAAGLGVFADDASAVFRAAGDFCSFAAGLFAASSALGVFVPPQPAKTDSNGTAVRTGTAYAATDTRVLNPEP